jgi:hypothetical protein
LEAWDYQAEVLVKVFIDFYDQFVTPYTPDTAGFDPFEVISSNQTIKSRRLLRVNEKPEPLGLWFAFSSGEWTVPPQRGLELKTDTGLVSVE